MFNETAIKYLYKHTKRAEGGLPQRLLDEVVEKCARFQVSFDNCCMKIGMLDDGNPFKQIRLSCIKGIEIVDNEMKLEFISKSNNEAFARIAVAAFASQLDPSIEELADIKTAVSEAVTNSIIHGYDNKMGIVKLKGKIIKNKLIIEISDNGKGIEDIEMAKEPLYTTKPNLERSGMGFTIMESFMDNIKIESIVGLGTKVIMEKTIKPKIERNKEEFEILNK